MNYFTKTFSLLAVSALIFSCSSDDDNDYGPDGLGVPISLSSRVTFEQRALQDLQIAEGQSLSFFVTLTGSTDDIRYDNYRITADGDGGFTYQQTMYYPVNDDNVDFFAIHPYAEGATLNQPLAFTVMADQSTENGYIGSDLLYAYSDDVRRTTNAVAMTFTHKLSKIDITVKQGGGVDLTELENIQILNLLPSTTIAPATGTLTAATGTNTTIMPYGMPGTITGTEVDGITAIVVPQLFTAGETLLRITVDGVPYQYAPTSDITFQSGFRYGFIITVNQTGIDVSSTITPWEDGGSISGEGTLD